MRRAFRQLLDRFSGRPTRTTAGHDDVSTAAEGASRPIPRKLLNAPNTYIFSLAPIRTKLGDRWEQFAPSVHRIAGRLIFSSLDGKGSFERFGDSYVLSFDRLRGKRAQQEGERLYRRFMELLSKGDGSDGSGHGRERHAGAQDDGHGEGGFLRRLLRRVRALFRSDDSRPAADPDEAEQVAPETAEPNPHGDAAHTQTPEHRHAAPRPRAGGNAAAQRIRTKRFKPLPDSRDNPDSALKAPRRADKSPENLKLLREARSMENAIALAVLRRQAQGFDAANRDFPPPDLSFIYRSMWNFGTRYLTTYTSVPICWKSSMEVHHGESIVPSPRRPENLFDLDLLCLENTIEILGRLTQQKRPVLFMNVVHASTLTHKDMLREFLARAESIPQAACRQLIFEIVDIGDYAHRPDAIQMVKTLLPYARAVTASVGLQDRNFAFWKQCGFMAVGADLSREWRKEEEVIAALGSFAAQAKRHKLLTYLRELDRFSLTIAAAGAGFDFLEGALIGSGDDPDKLALSKFDIENLYDDTPEVVWAY